MYYRNKQGGIRPSAQCRSYLDAMLFATTLTFQGSSAHSSLWHSGLLNCYVSPPQVGNHRLNPLLTVPSVCLTRNRCLWWRRLQRVTSGFPFWCFSDTVVQKPTVCFLPNLSNSTLLQTSSKTIMRAPTWYSTHAFRALWHLAVWVLCSPASAPQPALLGQEQNMWPIPVLNSSYCLVA